jgi:small GTP-binding protein
MGTPELNFISKVVVIGDAAVGKTSLIQKYTMNTFNEDYITTIGAQFSTYNKNVGPEEKINFKLLFWDLAGQSEYNFMRPTFYNGAEGAVLVYDLTRPETLDNVLVWYDELKENCGDIPSILFGNKSDLVNNAESLFKSKVDELLRKDDILEYYITSAKTGKHVHDGFNSIIQILLKLKM